VEQDQGRYLGTILHALHKYLFDPAPTFSIMLKMLSAAFFAATAHRDLQNK
jgi:hypothetical protein